MNLAYLRVSTHKQDTLTQKLQIQDYCKRQGICIDEFMEVEESTRKNQVKRGINELKSKLCSGNLLIAVELSRLGRSMLEVMSLVLELSNNMWAAFKVMFQGQTLREVAPVLLGGIIFGAASGIAGLLIN